MIHGRQDCHVPPSGRDKIRAALREAKVELAWFEPYTKHTFVRDELSKGRFDAPIDRADEIKYNEYQPKPQPMFLKPGRAKL